jgi:hypothetical protein
MSVGSLSTTGLNKLFLEYIKPGLNVELVKNTVVYDRFKTDKEAVMGKYGVMKLLTSSAKSARPSSTTSYPTALQSTYDEFIFYLKRGLYASLQFDGLALAVGKGAGAVKELVRAELDSQKIYIANKLNRQFWGDGSGRLAQVNAAVAASTSVIVDSPIFGIDANDYTPASNYLEDGIMVDIVNGTTGAKEVTGGTISSIALGGGATDTLTMSAAVTCAADSWVFDTDTYSAAEAAGTGVPMGLRGIINTANQTCGITLTTAFQGINRINYTFAQAQAFNMSSAAVTNKKILECIQKLEKWGRVSTIITNGPIWRALYVILEADKTMPNEKVYWGGTSGINFYGGKARAIPIIYDDDCPDGSMYFIDDSTIKVVSPMDSGLDYDRGDAGGILQKVQGKDEYAAHMKWYYNMTCNIPRANGYIYGIKHKES